MNIVNSGLEIISVHHPKTAGSTFKEILLQIYGDKQIIFDYLENPHCISKIPPQAKIIHGHFPVKKYEGYFPSAKRIVWLRHPILRVISLYFFQASRPEILKMKKPWTYDLIFQQNLGIVEMMESDPEWGLSPFLVDNKKLTVFYFVGIQEFFQEDIKELQTIFDWPDIHIPSTNRNQYPNYKERVLEILNDPKKMENLLFLQREDLELYQAALDLRAKRRNEPKIPHQLLLEKERSRLNLELINEKLECSRSRLLQIQTSLKGDH